MDTSTQPCEENSDFRTMLSSIATSFADVSEVGRVYSFIYPGRAIDDQEIVGVNVPLEELVLSNVEGFAKECLWNADSPHFHLKDMSGSVEKYLRHFDVKANGPDLLKHTLAFGLSLEAYTRKHAERPIVTKLVRLQTIRLLRAAAGIVRRDKVPPPVVMSRKFLKIWNDESEAQLLGLYGTYMAFKMWSYEDPAAANLAPAAANN